MPRPDSCHDAVYVSCVGDRNADLTRVSSKDSVRNFGPLSDKALTEPVTITRNGRDRLVHDSADLPNVVLDAVERTQMDPRHDPLDALVAE